MKTRIHAVAGGIALLMIVLFWSSTVLSELLGSHETIATVKGLILKGMFILIPAMAIAGGSGNFLAGNRSEQALMAKKKRMLKIAAIGILIMIPMAFLLERKASAGDFGTMFFVLQGVELIGGATNIFLMSLNIRDGLRLTGRNAASDKVRLLGREKVATDTLAAQFEKPAGFVFQPGQALRLTTTSGAARILSIASAPHEDDLMIVTRVRDSDFKNALVAMSEGETVQLVGPLGSFALDGDCTRSAVFLAGGIGITPFLSMIRHATHIGSKKPITLFYSNRTPADAAMLEELQSLSVANPNFQLVATMSDLEEEDVWSGETGWIDLAMLKRHIPDVSKPEFYAVGPSGFVKGMTEMLQNAGVDASNLNVENFSGY